MLPFSFWYAFSLFSTNFLDFQQAWTNFMVLNNGIHWTNSCKSNLELGGGANILDIVFDIDPSDMIVWWLIDFDSSGWYTWICFIFIVELTLFSIKVLMIANQVLSLYPPIPKFYEYACYHELYPCLNVVLDCLDTCLIISNEMHVEWYTIQTNFDVLW